jgi:hypothetical protein
VISGATYSWIQTLPPWIGIIIMGVVVLVVSIIVAYKRK